MSATEEPEVTPEPSPPATPEPGEGTEQGPETDEVSAHGATSGPAAPEPAAEADDEAPDAEPRDGAVQDAADADRDEGGDGEDEGPAGDGEDVAAGPRTGSLPTRPREPDTAEIPLAAVAAGAPPDESLAEPAPEPSTARATGQRPEGPTDEPVSEPVAEPSEPEPVTPVPVRAARMDARARLLSAMRPRATRAQILAALLCAGLGFGLVVQVRQTQNADLDNLRQSDLVNLLQNVNAETDRLQTEEREARAARDKLAGDETNGQVAETQARDRLKVLGVLAGTLPATGPGIELTIADPKRQVTAATLLDTLQELRDAGAEAVQIGQVRVVASTAFEDLDGGVRVGSRPLEPPYRYLVIGDPSTLDEAMRIPGGVIDTLEQKGATGTITRADSITITALHTVKAPQYARPAPDGGS